jgi:hypothetical protein
VRKEERGKQRLKIFFLSSKNKKLKNFIVEFIDELVCVSTKSGGVKFTASTNLVPLNSLSLERFDT